MPLILPSNSISAVGYEVDNSLRFDDGSSDRLNRTQSTGNQRTYTFSFWIKRQDLERQNNLISARYSNLNRYAWIYFNNEASPDKDRLHVQSGIYSTSSTTVSMRFTTTRVFRDVSAWYHIVIAVDTTQSTESDRVKIYINGVQETDFTNSTYPSQNDQHFFNINTTPMEIGAFNSSNYFSGYMSEVVLIDGQQLDSTSFGEFDADSGIWKPIDVSGLTFGTNGFYLDFENSGSLGADVSGNGNNFTVNNLTSIDQTTDTPTNNYATLNPLHRGSYLSGLTFSNGNTTIVSSEGGSNYPYTYSTLAVSSGKYYSEFKCTSDPTLAMCGISSGVANTYLGSGSEEYGYFGDNGNVYNSGTNYAFGSSVSANDIVRVAMDLDNNYVYFGINGTWQNSGDPTSGASGTGGFSITATSSLSTGVYHFACGDAGTETPTIQANFGNPPFTISSGNSDANGYGNFEYAVPSGYYALNTKNLAEYG